MKITMDIPKRELEFVYVPDIKAKYEIIHYGFAGTWLMQSTKTLNAWKTKISNRCYEIVGNTSNQLIIRKK